MATYSTSADLQAQASIVSGISENEITAGSATVAALVPEPNGTTVTYDGNTNLIISGINATLNGTYAYLPNVGFTRYSTGSNVYADYNEDYAVFYNDDGTNPRAVVFVSTPGTTKWLVSEYNVSATSWTDDALVGSKTQTGAFLNVNSVSAERPESGESSSTEEIFSGPSYVTGTAEREIVLKSGIDMPDDVSEVDGLAERVIVAITGGTQLKPTINNEVTGVAGRKVNTVSGIEQVQDATVAGVTEREVTGTGALVDAASVVAGVAERKIDPVNVALTSGEVGVAIVGGSVERQIDGELTTVDAQVSSTAGVSERVVVVANGDLTSDEVGVAIVGGSVERQIDGELTTVDAQVSAAAGTSERVIVVANGDLTSDEVGVATVGGVVERQIDGELTAADAQVSNVSGIGERIVTFEAFDVDGDGLFGELDAGPSSITATANRSYTISADLNDADANVVNGSSERVVPMIPEVGNGDFRPTEYHLVNGEGNRHSNALDGISQVGSSTVSAVAENIAPASGALTTSTSTVTGVAENKITGSGSLITGDSTLSGTSERVVVEIEADLTAEEVGVVAISGESERVIVGSGTLSSDSSSVSGVCERAVSGSGTLEAQSSTLSSTAARGANGEGTLSSQNSTVAGLSEREITSSGTLSVGESSFSGVAERQIDASGSGDSQDSSSDVVGVAERVISGSGTLVVEATLFPATGFSERSITGSGTPASDESTVSGVAENQVNAPNAAVQAGLSSVVGAAARHSNGTGELSAQESNLNGAAENIIVVELAVRKGDDATVNGLAERSIIGSGTLQDSVSIVSGISERTITGSGTLDTITDSIVAGVAENEITLESGIAQIDPSQVSGVSERTIVGSGTLVDAESTVAALAENVIPGDGTLTTGESVVVATTERTINRLPDINGYPEGHGDTAFGPDDADSQVDYVSRPQSYAPRYLELRSTSNVNRDGVYDVLISGFTVAESGLNYTTSATTTYNVYYKEHGSNYDVVVYNTTRSAWYLTTIGNIDDFFTGSISNATVAQESITSSNSVVPYGIEFDPLDAQPSEVVGLGFRTSVGSGELLPTENNIVNGLAERAVDADDIQIELTDDYSDVVGQALIGRLTSPELDTTPSLVDGLAERIVVDVDATPKAQESVVAGVAERIVVLESGVDMPDDDSKVVGVSERSINVSGIEQVQESIVTGVAERTINLFSGIEQVQESVVSGLSERTINASGALVDSSSTVAGASERVITGTGTLDTVTESLVTGVAERIINVSGIEMPDDDSKVAGVAERIIGKPFFDDPLQGVPSRVVGLAERTVENNNITLQVIAQESHVVGVAERTINLFSGIEQVQESTIVGIAERSITGEGELNTITDSLVSGIAERQIDAEGELNTITDSIVSGVAERIINTFSGVDMPDDDSKIDGVAERTINTFSGIEQVQESVVSGVSERTINTFSGILMPDDDSKVVGVAEREVETNEISQDLKPTDNNLVTGVAERIINLFESPKAQDADVGQDPEPIVIIRHPIGGTTYPEYRSDLYAGDAQPTLDADRVHTQETDGLSTKLKFGPSSSSSKVSYSGKYLKLIGMTNPNLDGDYDLLPYGFTSAVSSGNNLTLSTNKNYLVYYRKQGYQDYRAVVFRTNDLTWVAFETTLNPELFFQNGTVLTNAQLNGELVAFSSQSRGGPYKIMKPTVHNIVTGAAERNVEDNSATHELRADESVVSGFATRKIKPLDGALHAQPSVVVGTTEREIDDQNKADLAINAEPSIVDGTGVRHANGSGILVVGSSSVSGLAENQIDGEEGISQVDDAEVSGSGVRHSNALVGIEQVDASTVNGVSERTINGFGDIHAGEDHVTMTAKRTVKSIDATIQASPSQVLATDDRISVGVPGKCDPKAQDATVEATVIRTSNSLEATLDTTESDVIGEGHRTSNGSGELSTTDHLVDGISERKITAVGVCEAQDSTVVAVAEREIVSIQAALNVTPSIVDGFAFRKIIGEGDLQTTDCKVSAFVYTNNIEQQAIHTQRKFRIRKPRMRTILARQTPTN